MPVLLSFTNKTDFDQKFSEIRNEFSVTGPIEVWERVDGDELYVVFFAEERPLSSISNIVVVNYKRGSQTIFTINGLNQLVESLNGVRDPQYKIKWADYKRTLILPSAEGVRVIPIQKITQY